MFSFSGIAIINQLFICKPFGDHEIPPKNSIYLSTNTWTDTSTIKNGHKNHDNSFWFFL